MKRQVSTGYVFTPGSSTLDLTGVSGMSAGGLLAVLNVTKGSVVYTVGTPGFGGSFAGLVLTLQAALTGMAGTDTLAVIFDDSIQGAVEAGGNLAAIAAGTPSLGQKLAAGSVPVVLSIDGPFAANFGLQGDAAATSDAGASSLIGLIKRGLGNWTTLLARVPALVSGRVPVDGSGVTQPVSATALPLPAGAAQDGTDATGVAPPAGGSGLRGWASGIYAGLASLVSTTLGKAFRVVLVDPVTGNGSLVQAFHNADNQTLGGTAYGLMTGGVDQLLNAAGNLDRKRGVAGDAMAPTGLAAEVPMLWNGTGYDRHYGDKTNGAWVNVKAGSVTSVPAIGAPAEASAVLGSLTGLNLLDTVAASSRLGLWFCQNQCASPLTIVLDDGAGNNLSVFVLGGGPNAGSQGGSMGSADTGPHTGRIRVYGAAGSQHACRVQ